MSAVILGSVFSKFYLELIPRGKKKKNSHVCLHGQDKLAVFFVFLVWAGNYPSTAGIFHVTGGHFRHHVHP